MAGEGEGSVQQQWARQEAARHATVRAKARARARAQAGAELSSRGGGRGDRGRDAPKEKQALAAESEQRTANSEQRTADSELAAEAESAPNSDQSRIPAPLLPPWSCLVPRARSTWTSLSHAGGLFRPFICVMDA
jgi:hypothetical protein